MLGTFPLAFELKKNFPQMRQNAYKSGIFGHLGGIMLEGGTAREKNNFF